MVTTDPANHAPANTAQETSPVSDHPTTVTIINSNGYVNIRNGNGTTFEKITSARNGDTFLYVATATNGWHAILANNQVCWVSGNYSRIC